MAQNGEPVRAVVLGRPFVKGVSANPGGRPKKLVEIERMLDEDHRDVTKMREVFARLRALAMGEIVTVVDRHGKVDLELDADPAFMKLYLDRVMGAVKAKDDDLESAIELKLLEMIQEAKRKREQTP